MRNASIGSLPASVRFVSISLFGGPLDGTPPVVGISPGAMTSDQTSSARAEPLEKLLAAIEANVAVARGFGRSAADPSFSGSWVVMDSECAERVRKAAAALRQAAPTG